MEIKLVARGEETGLAWRKVLKIEVISGNDEILPDIDALIALLKRLGYQID